MKLESFHTRLHIFEYTNIGVKIIAPLKCGTRFLNKTSHSKYHQIPIDNIAKELNSDFKIYFIERDPMEHLYSALLTEAINKYDDQDGVNIHSKWESRLLLRSFNHWTSDLYKQLFEDWKIRHLIIDNVEFINLANLSHLISEYGISTEFDKNEYNFSILNQNPHNLNIEYVIEQLKKENPKKYFDLEMSAIRERYFLYKFKNKITK